MVGLVRKHVGDVQLPVLGALSFAFVFGGITGWICELIVGYMNNGYVNLQHGGIGIPFLTIYAFGALVYEFIFRDIEPTPTNVVRTFLLMMFLAFLIEYATGLFMLNMLGVQTWDYRIPGWDWLFVTSDGLVCARGLLSFGMLGLVQIFGFDGLRRHLQEKCVWFDTASIILAILIMVYICAQYVTGNAVMM